VAGNDTSMRRFSGIASDIFESGASQSADAVAAGDYGEM
jgi:hypothetical protein